MELFLLYSKLIFGSLIGMAIQLFLKNKSFLETAQKANVQYSLNDFWRNDKWTLGLTFASISVAILISSDAISNTIDHTPIEVSPYLWGFLWLSAKDIIIAIVTTMFITIGYMGQDFLLRFLSRTSKELKAAIDFKTTKSDTADGTLDKPTPVK